MLSIKILCQGVQHFSSSSSLEANYTKSSIHLVGVSDNFRMHATSTLDFTFESLPVKYLRMPLTSKRYTAPDCEYLVDKMTSRIRSWIAKKLSETARLQLVNSVLIRISNYWSQTVILPKRVINQINAVYCSYLCHGETTNRASGNMNWEKVCRPKKEGGLGIRNLRRFQSLCHTSEIRGPRRARGLGRRFRRERLYRVRNGG